MRENMTCETAVDQAMILSGDRAQLRELLKMRLHESGWVDHVRTLSRKVIKEENGQVTVDRIVEKVTPAARKSIPDVIKKELLTKITNLLMAQYNELDE